MYIPHSKASLLGKLMTFSTRSNYNPIIMLRDFNSWSSLWGSRHLNSRGKILERAIAERSLVLVKNGSETHLFIHCTFTHVDISMVSAQIVRFLRLSSWEWPLPHINVPLFVFSPDYTPPLPIYNTFKANWHIFKREIVIRVATV